MIRSLRRPVDNFNCFGWLLLPHQFLYSSGLFASSFNFFLSSTATLWLAFIRYYFISSRPTNDLHRQYKYKFTEIGSELVAARKLAKI